MGGVPKPRPCFLDRFAKSHVDGDRQVYVDTLERVYYTWDSLHGEIEVFNCRGRHLGAIHAVSGELIKDAKQGRKIKI
nr:colicin E3/pyocin S6 family cytotoxin [uncultured Pseudomonas sp.]